MPTASFVLQRPDGRLLMELRKKPKEYCGKWLFPGGKVEDGETPEQAMIREAQEELHITPTVYTKIETPEPMFTITRTPYPIEAWLVTEWEGEVPSYSYADGELLGWFPPNYLFSSVYVSSVRQIALEIIKGRVAVPQR